MNRIQNLLIILIACFLLSACATVDVDRTVDFAKLRTFEWGKSEVLVDNPLYKGDLIDKKIVSVVESEFAKRGIHRSGKRPDFTISYKTYSEEKERRKSMGYGYSGYPGFFPYRFGFFPFGYWPAPYYPVTEQYTEGTLILDVADAQTGETVWRGSVSGDIGETRNLEKLIGKAIKAIMKKYPVKDRMVSEQDQVIS